MLLNLKRPWRLRFSLKAFLLVCLVSAFAVAWVGESYNDYVAEQKLIKDLTTSVTSSSLLTIATNGNSSSYGGGVVL